MARNKYIIAYLGWVAGTLLMSGVALAWYRKVEDIGWREVGARFRTDATGDTEDTEARNG